MANNENNINRRNFLKTIGVAGLGSVLVSKTGKADSNEPNAPKSGAKSDEAIQKLPTRKLGKTGVEVTTLSLGIMFNAAENQMVLRKAYSLGITYWDTAYGYAGGNSEIGIGKFLAAKPEIRKDLFIASKASGGHNAKDVESRLQESLKRMNTNYIDLYFLHGVSNPDELTNEMKEWAADAKKRGVIKFFGFTTHTNMEKCLMAASKLDWIDAIMTSYNYRLMQSADMQAAVEACNKAGIGLVAMKSQGKRSGEETDADKKITEHFVKKGFTAGQAKVKVVLEDNKFAADCVGMNNIEHLVLNANAVLDKTAVTKSDMQVLAEYAKETCSGYCAGCADICAAAMTQEPNIAEVMRYLMYYNGYGEKDMARELFAQLPADVRGNLLKADYSLAQAKCPQKLPIAKLMKEAVSKLA